MLRCFRFGARNQHGQGSYRRRLEFRKQNPGLPQERLQRIARVEYGDSLFRNCQTLAPNTSKEYAFTATGTPSSCPPQKLDRRYAASFFSLYSWCNPPSTCVALTRRPAGSLFLCGPPEVWFGVAPASWAPEDEELLREWVGNHVSWGATPSTPQLHHPIILTAAPVATVARIRHIPQLLALRAFSPVGIVTPWRDALNPGPRLNTRRAVVLPTRQHHLATGCRWLCNRSL